MLRVSLSMLRSLPALTTFLLDNAVWENYLARRTVIPENLRRWSKLAAGRESGEELAGSEFAEIIAVFCGF